MKKLILGIVIGILVAVGFGFKAMPGMMLKEVKSPYSVEDTVAKIKENAKNKGWVVPSVQPLHKSILKHSHGEHEIPLVMLVNLCNAEHAFHALDEDDCKKVSVFMPCTISVFEKSNGDTYLI